VGLRSVPAGRQLAEAPGPGEALAAFERVLLARLPAVRGMHPGVAASLARLRAGAGVDDAVRCSGLSHRHLIVRFREATGLAPKQLARLLRLQRALAALQLSPADLADVALHAGYSDQAHFGRDFREMTGMTPGAWRQARPEHTHHVPAPPTR
jgi:AraC-like DNA-binding protein